MSTPKCSAGTFHARGQWSRKYGAPKRCTNSPVDGSMFCAEHLAEALARVDPKPNAEIAALRWAGDTWDPAPNWGRWRAVS